MEHKAVRFQLYVLRYNVTFCLVLDSHQQFTGYVHVTVTSTRHMEVTLYNGSGWKMNQYKPWTKYRKTIQQILKGGVLYSVTCWSGISGLNGKISVNYKLTVLPLKLMPDVSRAYYPQYFLLSAVAFGTVAINPIVHVYWLIILKHHITSFVYLTIISQPFVVVK